MGDSFIHAALFPQFLLKDKCSLEGGVMLEYPVFITYKHTGSTETKQKRKILMMIYSDAQVMVMLCSYYVCNL